MRPPATSITADRMGGAPVASKSVPQRIARIGAKAGALG
jgi:hypothetical protein